MTFLSGDTCGGIIFNMEVSFLTSYSEFFICTDGSYHLNDVSVLSTSVLQGYTTMNTGVRQINVIAVVANGTNIDLYINGQKINSMSSKTSSVGTIGLGVYGLNSNVASEAAFNDAKVWTF